MLKVNLTLRDLDLKADQNAVRVCVRVVWLGCGYFPVPFPIIFGFGSCAVSLWPLSWLEIFLFLSPILHYWTWSSLFCPK